MKNRNTKANQTMVFYNGKQIRFDTVNEASQWVIDTFGNTGKRKTIASNISTSTKNGKLVNGLRFFTMERQD